MSSTAVQPYMGAAAAIVFGALPVGVLLCRLHSAVIAQIGQRPTARFRLASRPLWVQPANKRKSAYAVGALLESVGCAAVGPPTLTIALPESRVPARSSADSPATAHTVGIVVGPAHKGAVIEDWARRPERTVGVGYLHIVPLDRRPMRIRVFLAWPPSLAIAAHDESGYGRPYGLDRPPPCTWANRRWYALLLARWLAVIRGCYLQSMAGIAAHFTVLLAKLRQRPIPDQQRPIAGVGTLYGLCAHSETSSGVLTGSPDYPERAARAGLDRAPLTGHIPFFRSLGVGGYGLQLANQPSLPDNEWRGGLRCG